MTPAAYTAAKRSLAASMPARYADATPAAPRYGWRLVGSIETGWVGMERARWAVVVDRLVRVVWRGN